MGRKKIKIEQITDNRIRQVTLYKRIRGLLKKAMELSVLCNIDILLYTFDRSNEKCLIYYSREDIEKFIDCEIKKIIKVRKVITNQDFDRIFNPESRVESLDFLSSLIKKKRQVKKDVNTKEIENENESDYSSSAVFSQFNNKSKANTNNLDNDNNTLTLNENFYLESQGSLCGKNTNASTSRLNNYPKQSKKLLMKRQDSFTIFAKENDSFCNKCKQVLYKDCYDKLYNSFESPMNKSFRNSRKESFKDFVSKKSLNINVNNCRDDDFSINKPSKNFNIKDNQEKCLSLNYQNKISPIINVKTNHFIFNETQLNNFKDYNFFFNNYEKNNNFCPETPGNNSFYVVPENQEKVDKEKNEKVTKNDATTNDEDHVKHTSINGSFIDEKDKLNESFIVKDNNNIGNISFTTDYIKNLIMSHNQINNINNNDSRISFSEKNNSRNFNLNHFSVDPKYSQTPINNNNSIIDNIMIGLNNSTNNNNNNNNNTESNHSNIPSGNSYISSKEINSKSDSSNIIIKNKKNNSTIKKDSNLIITHVNKPVVPGFYSWININSPKAKFKKPNSNLMDNYPSNTKFTFNCFNKMSK